jgi:FMN phosphatase YigB (HAD superfamily)
MGRVLRYTSIMRKGIILFDIDRTIFDTDKMNYNYARKIIRLIGNVNEADFLSAKEKYKVTIKDSRGFVPEDFAKIICQELKYSHPEIIEDIFMKYDEIYRDCIYPDFFDVLERLRSSFELGIFSEGNIRYQNCKLVFSGLSKLVNPEFIYIFDNKNTREVVNKLPKNAIVVDDKESVCEYLTKNGIRAIWLNKKDNRVSPNFPTIHNLLDLPDYL